MKSNSYRPASCCKPGDCDWLDDDPDEPCWGQVVPDSPGYDEYGWPMLGHLCQGHLGKYEIDKPNFQYVYKVEC